MSVTEEDAELRELVVHTLESNGVLGKIKAQLRASVFLTLDEEEKKNPLENEKLNSFVETAEGNQVISLFKEFLKFYNLEFTTSVFEPEINTTDHSGRERLARDLNIVDSGEVTLRPLICEVIRKAVKPHAPFEKEYQFDFDKFVNEKSQQKQATDVKSDGFNKFKMDTTKRKNSEENGGSSISSIVMPSAADKILKWDKRRVSNFDVDQSTGLESSNSNFSHRSSKLKSLKSSRSSRSGEEDEYDEENIEEDIEEDDSSTNRSDSILKDDDMTSDRTISPTDQSAACDYIEEVLKT